MGFGQCSHCGDIHHDSEDCSIRIAEKQDQAEVARLTAELAESQARESNLAMFVRRMRRVMDMNGLADREVCRQATTYLKAIGATGSVLRDEDIQEQAAEKGGGE